MKAPRPRECRDPAWVRPYKCCSCILNYLRSKLANLGVRLANVCSPLFFVEGLSREPRLVSSLRITLNLPQAGVAANSCDLMGRAAGFCQSAAGCFAQTVCGAFPRQAGFDTTIAKPTAKPCRGKWLVVFSHQKSQVFKECLV